MNKEIINGEAKESLPQGEFFSIDKEDFSKVIFIAKKFAKTEKREWGVDSFGEKYYFSRKNIEFILNEGELEILATGKEDSILNFSLNQEVKKEGCFIVDAKILHRVLDSLLPGEINCRFVQKEEENPPHAVRDYLQIKSGRAEFNLITFTSPKMETLALPEGGPLFTISCGDFLEACKQVVFAASDDESRPVLTGVLFKVKENQLTFMAADGYRASKKVIDGVKANQDIEAIVPKKSLLKLSWLLSNVSKYRQKNPLEIYIDGDREKILFSHSDFKMISSLLEGKFPNLEEIIPKGWTTKVNVRTKELLDATRRTVSLYTPEKANVPIIVEIGNSKLEITTKQYDKGIYRDKTFISIENVEIEGKEEKICLNPVFLLDFLRSTKSKMVSFEINYSLKPIIFKPADDESYLHMIMPIRMLE